MLRRVVKDHSDIKKSLMMRTKISVWNLKESTIGRSRLAIRDVFPGMTRLCRMSQTLFWHWWAHMECLQIDRLILSF